MIDEIQALGGIAESITVTGLLIWMVWNSRKELKSEHTRASKEKAFYRSLSIALIISLIVAIAPDEKTNGIATAFSHVEVEPDD